MRPNITLLAGPKATWGWGTWFLTRLRELNVVDPRLNSCSCLRYPPVIFLSNTPSLFVFSFVNTSVKGITALFSVEHLAAGGKKRQFPVVEAQHNTCLHLQYLTLPLHTWLVELNFSSAFKSLAVSNTGLNATIAETKPRDKLFKVFSIRKVKLHLQ